MAHHRVVDAGAMNLVQPPKPGTIPPITLGPMPADRAMTTIDEAVVRAPLAVIFELARDVDRWPLHLRHYRFVRFTEHDGQYGGIVEMSANRPFGFLNWPTFWRSEMEVIVPQRGRSPLIRFRHIGGITTGMDVVWEFSEQGSETAVRLVHVWNGPPLPLVGSLAARAVIGPVFIHGIASRTLAGLAHVAEQMVGTAHQ